VKRVKRAGQKAQKANWLVLLGACPSFKPELKQASFLFLLAPCAQQPPLSVCVGKRDQSGAKHGKETEGSTESGVG
jgi:hypothetical protein